MQQINNEALSPSAPRATSAAQLNSKPRTDTTTIVLHWTTAIAFVVSLFTGVRIAADALDARFSQWLSPILPQGEIWTWHFLSGLTLFFCVSAYTVYIARSKLAARNNLKKLRVLAAPVPARMKWGAVNIALHWFVYVLIAVLTATGVVVYLGYGGIWMTIHSYAAFIGLGYFFVHVFTHFMYGGLQQWLRLFRPTPLKMSPGVKPKPVLAAVVVGLLFAGAVAAMDWTTRDTLVVAKVAEGPKLDGVLDDAAWRQARPVTTETQQGIHLTGNAGASTITARAVQDGKKIYFAFEWTDPTRSLRRVPLIKKDDGWYTLDEGNDRADVNKFYEDKFAILFADKPHLGGAGSTGFGPNPVADRPATLHGRGFHYTTDGSTMDLWQWKASRGGVLGRVDDQYFGPVREATEAEKTGNGRYQAGYWNDPGRAFYSYNNNFERKHAPGEKRRPVKLSRLPKDVAATIAAMGKYDLNPDSSDPEESRWFMTEADTEPYTAEKDAQIPVGTVLPGVLIMGNYEGDRADVVGGAKWKDGKWTLETARNLVTGSKFDKDFVSGHDLYMWVAAFDHTQTRHSRHHRAIRVTMP